MKNANLTVPLMKTTAKLLSYRQPKASILEGYTTKKVSTYLNPPEVSVSIMDVIKPGHISALKIQTKLISGFYLVIKNISAILK